MTPKNKKNSDELRSKLLPIRVNKNEFEVITKKAEDHGLNASTFLRNLSMNYPVKSMVDREVVSTLLRVNGDLGKVGGLLKMWLMRNGEYKDDFSARRTYENIDDLVDELQNLMKLFRTVAGDIMDKL